MNLHDKTITVLNKLKSSASTTKQDIWYKTVITNCGWYVTSISDMNGSNVVMSQTIKVMIPFSSKFLPYNEWKNAGMQIDHYTISRDDYIILGTVEEDITSSNILQVVQKYAPDVCTVKSFRNLDKRVGNTIQLYVEGV